MSKSQQPSTASELLGMHFVQAVSFRLFAYRSCQS
jgi:hypothetical protein